MFIYVCICAYANIYVYIYRYMLYIYIQYELVFNSNRVLNVLRSKCNRVKKNSKIQLEVPCYSCNHQVFKFNLVLKLQKYILN